MGRAPRVAATAGFFAAGAAASVLVLFLKDQGLERASMWAGILVLFLTIAIAVSGVWVAWLSVMILRETRGTGEAPGGVKPPVAPSNADVADSANGSQEQPGTKSGSTFNVHVKRDAYAAHEMTVINVSNDEDSEPGISA